MDEYIKKSTAIAIVSDCVELCPFEKNEAIRRIEASTAADVVPVVHGRWLFVASVFGRDFWVCSECGRSIKTNEDNPVNKFPYCHCGARMEKEE